MEEEEQWRVYLVAVIVNMYRQAPRRSRPLFIQIVCERSLEGGARGLFIHRNSKKQYQKQAPRPYHKTREGPPLYTTNYDGGRDQGSGGPPRGGGHQNGREGDPIVNK